MTIPLQQSLNVLVVDDEATIRSLFAQLLKQLGPHQVVPAENGEQALELVQRCRFDCAFLDLMMPGLCGTDLVDRLLHESPNTSVIIITGYPSMEVVIDTMRHGAVDFIPKPFSLDDIRLALQRLLREQQWVQRHRTLSEELERKREVEKLNRELEKRSREQAVLYTIVDKLSHVSHTGELCDRLVQLAADVSEAEQSWFTIFDETKTHLMTVAERGLGSQHLGTRCRVNRLNGRVWVDLKDMPGKLVGQSPAAGAVRVDTMEHQGRLLAVPVNIRSEPFGVLWIASKRNSSSFTSEHEFPLRFMTEKAALAIENIALYENLRENLLSTLHALVSAIEAKDSYTEQHSKRVTELAIEIAKVMNRTAEEIEALRLCGTLHDIGKIGIHDSILNKPGKLTDDEFAIIKTHPVIGERIVEHLGLSSQERAIVRNHHERWDGTGYPDGLRGPDNPALARILAVADAFDAMTTDRTYRQALALESAMADLQRNRATQFDPEPVDALRRLSEQGFPLIPKK
jgi:putative nucleotidyltransferase with HDIG domain